MNNCNETKNYIMGKLIVKNNYKSALSMFWL